jgi:hypothetical protein
VFCSLDEVVPLTRRVEGSLCRLFPTREEAEVFATAERLYAVDRVQRNKVLKTWNKHNQFVPRAYKSKTYKFFATRQAAEAFLQPKEGSDAEPSSAKPTSEDAGKVAVVGCWCRLRDLSIVYVCMYVCMHVCQCVRLMHGLLGWLFARCSPVLKHV